PLPPERGLLRRHRYGHLRPAHDRGEPAPPAAGDTAGPGPDRGHGRDLGVLRGVRRGVPGDGGAAGVRRLTAPPHDFPEKLLSFGRTRRLLRRTVRGGGHDGQDDLPVLETPRLAGD